MINVTQNLYRAYAENDAGELVTIIDDNVSLELLAELVSGAPIGMTLTAMSDFDAWQLTSLPFGIVKGVKIAEYAREYTAPN